MAEPDSGLKPGGTLNKSTVLLYEAPSSWFRLNFNVAISRELRNILCKIYEALLPLMSIGSAMTAPTKQESECKNLHVSET